MSVSGEVVIALIVVALVVGVVAVTRSRRVSRTATAALLFPNTAPIPLGGHAVVRFTAAGPLPDTDSPVTAVLVCRERVPGAPGAEPTITVVSRVDCPVRVMTHEPVGEAEIRLDIPLSASPTMSFADHRVEWTLTVEMSSNTVERAVQIAPVVARAVLQGDVKP